MGRVSIFDRGRPIFSPRLPLIRTTITWPIVAGQSVCNSFFFFSFFVDSSLFLFSFLSFERERERREGLLASYIPKLIYSSAYLHNRLKTSYQSYSGVEEFENKSHARSTVTKII